MLIDLYRPPELDRAEDRTHKTPAQLMCRLLHLVLMRFPGRAFVIAEDSGRDARCLPGCATATAAG